MRRQLSAAMMCWMFVPVPAALPAAGEPEPQEPLRAVRPLEPLLERGSMERREPAGSLPDTVRALAREVHGPFWMGYAAPLAEGKHIMCSFSGHVGTRGRARNACCGCDLEKDKGVNIGSDSCGGRLEGDERFMILARVSSGRVERLRPLSIGCTVDPGRLTLYWIGEVDAPSSLAWLKGFALEGADSGDDELSGSAVMTIALHRGDEPDRLLASFLEGGRSMDLREQAAFWSGTTRGEAGSALLRRMLDEREGVPRELRKKIVFGLSQNEAPGSLEALVRTARSDRDSELRQEAIFWLSQKAGEKAARTIGEAIEDDPDVDVKKKAVFGLSQLPADEGVPRLIDLVRRHRHPEIRREALFWLGQSGDPRALEFIEEILDAELSSAPRSSTKDRM